MNPALRAVLLMPAWTPLRLRGGRAGAWLDPSDLSYMTQDSAGTTGAALNQPIGKIVDRFGFSAHGVQATAGSRPTLSARVNMLTGTETGAGWNGDGATLTAYDGVVAGTGAASSFGLATTTGIRYPRYVVDAASGVAVKCRAYLWLASGTATVRPAAYYAAGWQLLAADLGLTETPTLYEWTYTPSTATSFGSAFALEITGTADVRITAADCRLSAHASLPSYQRVTSASDYATSGFPQTIDFDTVDDALVCTLPVDMGTNCTVARAVRGTGASILTGQTIGTTYSDNTDHCGLVIVNGALTETETTRLTVWLNRKAGV